MKHGCVILADIHHPLLGAIEDLLELRILGALSHGFRLSWERAVGSWTKQGWIIDQGRNRPEDGAPTQNVGNMAEL